MQNAEQVADDCAGNVSVWLQSGKSDRRDHGKKDLRAKPDDQRKVEQRSKQCLHACKDKPGEPNSKESLQLSLRCSYCFVTEASRKCRQIVSAVLRCTTDASDSTVACCTSRRLPKCSMSRCRVWGPTPGISSSSDLRPRLAR